jgi:hypothetical protein
MADPGLLGRGDEVCGRRGEEMHHRVVLEGRRIGDVNQYVGSAHRVGQTRTGEHVGTRTTRSRDGFMPRVVQQRDHLLAALAGGPHHGDFHCANTFLSVSMASSTAAEVAAVSRTGFSIMMCQRLSTFVAD